MITHVNFSKGFRGGERQTLLLINEIAKNGRHQRLITRSNSELALRAKTIEKLNIIEISKPYFISLNCIKNSSIVHAHEARAAQFSYFGYFRYQIPYIITKRIDRKIRNHPLNRLTYKHASAMVGISRVITKKLLDFSSASIVKTIPSALAQLPFDDKNINTLKERFKSKFLIGHIGELDDATKGQSFIIEAARMLQNKFPMIHFIFIGKGKDLNRYKEQSKNLNNITFEGFVDNVGDYISVFDLFIFPSIHEGLGSTLLDVMSFDTPIIATNVGGIVDIIIDNKNGLLIKPKNSQDIYNAILLLFNDPLLAKSFSTQAKLDSHGYTPKIMAQRYLDLYSSTANQ